MLKKKGTNKRTAVGQLVLRLSLGAGFLLPVMDRLGWLGAPGSDKVSWGNWGNFVKYTHTLIPFVSEGLASGMALLVTMTEIVLGIGLIIGFRTKWMALGAFALTLIFAICMAVSSGVYAPFAYPVLVFTGSALLLSGVAEYKWSIDQLRNAEDDTLRSLPA